MAEKTFTDSKGVSRKVVWPKSPVEFDVFPRNFVGADRECGNTCGFANRAVEKEVLDLFPGKAEYIEFTRSRAHAFTVIGKRPVMIPYALSQAVINAIAEFDKTGKHPKKVIRARLGIPTTSGGGGVPTGEGKPRKPAVRRGFYIDERTGKRMKYTIHNGDPIKVSRG